MENSKTFTKDFTHNLNLTDSLLRARDSFDIIRRDIVIAGHKARIYSIDGLVKDTAMGKIMIFFYSIKDENFFTVSHLFD